VPLQLGFCASHGDSLLPLTFGLTLPTGAWRDGPAIVRLSDHAAPAPAQTRVLSRWPDESVKWLLVHCLLRPTDAQTAELVLHTSPPDGDRALQLEAKRAKVDEIMVNTGLARFRLTVGDSFLASSPTAVKSEFSLQLCRLICTNRSGKPTAARVERLHIEEAGPVTTAIGIEGKFGRRWDLEFSGSLRFYAGTSLVRIEITAKNPRRARHAGGYWDLGDPGSALLKGLSIELETTAAPDRQIQWLEQTDSILHKTRGDRLEILQESSGGVNWNSRNHVNRDGQVPLRYSGYKVHAAEGESGGWRASPVVCLSSSDGYIACALEEFWEKFPSAIEVDGRVLVAHLWPRHWSDLHELQAGEHCTRVLWLELGRNAQSACERLAWVHSPPLVTAAPNWIAESGAVPFFPSRKTTIRHESKSIIRNAIEGDQSFFAKREAIDEYGWRNFGDMWADHEQAFADDPQPVISHYNNQYDILHGLLIQFLASGDRRFWQLADPLARHVMDIDVYHTERDKSAYNGGLFWHTAHYHSAATSTHRCVSTAMRGSKIPAPGTGPCNEHNYTSGLLLYYYLTGCERARQTVVGFTEWVMAMDEGGRHVLGVLSDQPTGDASRTCSGDYHGPGRGAANSINALLDGWLLTGDDRYRDKIDELIRRCIHPADDVPARRLEHAELRWSYTVFLQALVRFLDVTRDRNDFAQLRVYAQASLLHYARWMTAHERFYLDDADQLEYPTETWAAQELRKGTTLLMAARLAAVREADCFRNRGLEILDRAWQSLVSFESCHFTRPTAIVLQQVYLESYLRANAAGDSVASGDDMEIDDGSPPLFLTQRQHLRQLIQSPAGVVRICARAVGPYRWFRALQQFWIAERARRVIGLLLPR
jgi:hypothetical protein